MGSAYRGVPTGCVEATAYLLVDGEDCVVVSAWMPPDIIPDKLMRFMGYGVDRPRFIFVGLEEYGSPDEATLHRNLAIRCSSLYPEEGLADLRTAHLELAPAALNPFGPYKVDQWEYACRISASVLAAIPQGVPTDSWASLYQYELGRRKAGGFITLTELYPLPKADRREWPAIYTRWFPRKSQYGPTAWERRRLLLRTLFAEPRTPKYAFCYGTSAWDEKYADAPANFPALFEIRPSIYQGNAQKWHTVHTRLVRGADKDIIRIGITAAGTYVAMTGFFGGAAPDKLRIEEIPVLVRALTRLEQANPSSWSP